VTVGIPLSEIIDGDTGSMREQATANNLPYEPFTMRELITPQYQVDLESSSEDWENWVGQHDDGRVELRPTNREQLVAAVVQKAHEGGEVRAVGSGHSHSNAPAPSDTYIELNPGDPPLNLDGPLGTPERDGLNSLLDHEGWLKSDDDLQSIYGGRDDFYNPFGVGGPLDDGLTRNYLKRLQSGVMLRRLNRHILREYGDQAYALKNMGSFDGQTIAGAVNTSTHGTGVTIPSISDAVKSVEIATVPESESGDPIVRLYRIEPTNGITDRKAFEADTGDHEMELIQNDDVFHSVVVGYGCMGVVYAYTMHVVDSYWLEEETELMAWSTLKGKLGTDEQSVREFLTQGGTRHCQILLNTAAEQVPNKNARLRQHEAHDAGQHEDWRDPVCLVKRHKLTRGPPGSIQDTQYTVSEPNDWVNFTKDQRWPPERRKKPFRDAGKFFLKFHPLSKNHGKAKQLHNNFFHPEVNKDQFVGGLKESVWYVALRRLRDRVGTAKKSEYRHPIPPGPATPTTEVGVGVGDVVETIDTFRETVRNVTLNKTVKGHDISDTKVFFSAPMGIRFTAASDHYLSPEHDRTTAMVELPLPLPGEGKTAGGLKPAVPALDHDEMRRKIVLPALTEVETSIRDGKSGLGPRPHMGKHNTVDADWLDSNYEYFDAAGTDRDVGWYQAYERFNAFGTFDNKFTDQLGLDGFTPDAEPDDDTTELETVEPTPRNEPAETATSTEGEPPGTEADAPGLGFLTGLAGIGTGAWLLNRQANNAESGADETASGTGKSDTGPDETADSPAETDDSQDAVGAGTHDGAAGDADDETN